MTSEKKIWANVDIEDLVNIARESVLVDELWDLIRDNSKIITGPVPVTKTWVNRLETIKSKSVWDCTCLVKARKHKEKAWVVLENNPTSFEAAGDLRAQNHERC